MCCRSISAAAETRRRGGRRASAQTPVGFCAFAATARNCFASRFLRAARPRPRRGVLNPINYNKSQRYFYPRRARAGAGGALATPRNLSQLPPGLGKPFARHLFSDGGVALISSRTRCAVLLGLAIGAGCAAPARADGEREEQARLAESLRANPADYNTAYRYVLLSTELRDYEAGIGALERLLMFNPNLSRARKELGFLYARLGAYELAAQHLRAARDGGDLDATQMAQIESQLPDIEKRMQTNRLSVRMHTGLRVQSNASFFPSNGLFQVGGVGIGSVGSRKSDVNSFQLIQAAHDLDFENQRGDALETRVTAYATQQFSLPQYSVALFAGSIGPRFVIAPETFRGLSVRPYLTGAVSMLGSTNYLNAGGAGLSFRAEVTPEIAFEPGFEWRALWVDRSRGVGVSQFYSSLSTLATGDVVTGYLGGSFRITNNIRLDGRVAYSRANAGLASQSSDQVDVQAMLRLEVDPPHPLIGRKWTIAPYARFTQLAFDSANFLVNPWVARRDAAWIEGIMLDAPITATFGFNGQLEFARNDSNLTNFKTNNVSVTFGPTARF